MDTPLKKNEKFIAGLRADIGKQLSYHLEKRFEEIVNMVIRHETMYPTSKQLAVATAENKPKGKDKRKFWDKKKGGNKKGKLDKTDIKKEMGCKDPDFYVAF